MQNSTSRRLFLGKSTKLALGGLLVPTVLLVSEKVGAADSTPALGYLASYADMRSVDLNSKQLKIEGRVYDRQNLTKLSDVEIEVWHTREHSTKFVSRAKIKTDEFGRYQLLTNQPAKEPGKSASIIHFKVSANGESYETELLVSDFGAYITDKHWALNNKLGDNLFPRQHNSGNLSELIFNFSI